MNKKLNIKKWLPLVFLALSVASLWFWLSDWEYFAYKLPLTLTNDFDWFMFKTFHWSHATYNIFFYGHLASSAIFLFLALYYWGMGVKRAYDNGEAVFLWWNKKVFYAIAFWVLSLLTLGSWGVWLDFPDKIKSISVDYFIRQTLGLKFNIADIFSDGPIILVCFIFLLFYVYFGTAGLKDRFVKEKSGILIKIISLAILGILLFLVGIVLIGVVFSFGGE